jgi:E3 ubiquitin-protein ligase DOA10
MEESCLFCLEPVKSTEGSVNPVGCSCQLKSHGTCLQEWFEQKQQYECPICHTVSTPNPSQPVYHVVYVQQDVPIHNPMIDPRHQKCIAVCCLSLMGWTVILTILDLIFRA